jgi:hypothetical protein
MFVEQVSPTARHVGEVMVVLVVLAALATVVVVTGNGSHGLLGKQDVPPPRLTPPSFLHALSGTARQSASVTMLAAGWRAQHATAFFGPLVRPHEDFFTYRLSALMTPAFRCDLSRVLIACFTHRRSALLSPVQVHVPALS